MSESITPAVPTFLRTSPTIAALCKALALAAAEFENVEKDREVKVKSDKGQYTFAYATLAEIVASTRPALTRHGIYVMQMPTMDGQKTILVTRVLHESGEWIEGFVLVPTGGNMQALGSALTYLRRYAYSAALGIVASEDDDGNGAMNQPYETRDRQPRQQRTEQREDNRPSGPNPGDYIAEDGRVYPTSNPNEWLEAWIKRTNTLMEAGNVAGLQAAFDRNKQAIAATRERAPDLAKQVEDAVTGALAKVGGKSANDDAAKLWIIYHRDPQKAPDPFDGAASWIGGWRIRAKSVEGAKAPAKAKRGSIAEMLTANEPAFAALEAAGHGKQVAEARDLLKRLDTKLASQEADEMTGGAA